MKKKISFEPTSDWAYLDVKRGREALRKLVEDRGYRIPVTITGTITCVHSGDDGVSREFQVDVSKIKLDKPIKLDIGKDREYRTIHEPKPVTHNQGGHHGQVLEL